MRKLIVPGWLILAIVTFAGCSKPATSEKKVPGPAQGPDGKIASVAKEDGEHKHDGWWCDAHGIPEEECSICSPKVAAEFKKKGDWCNQHDRAKSQCFVCDPKLKDQFAAKYRAKYGQEPPALEDEKHDEGNATKKKG